MNTLCSYAKNIQFTVTEYTNILKLSGETPCSIFHETIRHKEEEKLREIEKRLPYKNGETLVRKIQVTSTNKSKWFATIKNYRKWKSSQKMEKVLTDMERICNKTYNMSNILISTFLI